MFAKVNGIRLFYDVEGAKLVPEPGQMREKPTVLLLHGGPGVDHSDFKPAMTALAEVAQLVYLDQRGNGRSERGSREHWTLDQWADDVREFCEVTGIERPIVVGNSFGSWVAIRYAARHPDHPAKLALIATSARFRLERSLAAFRRLGGEEAQRIAARFFAEPALFFERYIDHCLPLYSRKPSGRAATGQIEVNLEVGAHFISGEWRTFDLFEDLAKITVPTLILAGDHDPITTTEDALEAFAALPERYRKLVRYPEAGHALLADVRDAVLEELRNYCLNR